jgi:DNA polymerase I-like protein with 3'-5' exonuclease and polymerase domains/ssDNA-binding Zn-finger/Zn-ribbon topoisomerase 1
MRFSSKGDLPPSEWITKPKDVERVAQALVDSKSIYGFDTETDGLGYKMRPNLRKAKKKKKEKIKHAGNGLGAYLEVVPIAFDNGRYGIDVGRECRQNLEILAPAIYETQARSCCFNATFDWNVWDWNTDGKWPLTTCYADGMTLWQLFDEDAEDTHGRRGLKPRTAHYLGLPMSTPMEQILDKGGIRACLQNPKYAYKVRNYCTRDGWAHLGVCALGERLARKLVWCMRCPKCSKRAYIQVKGKTWECYDCGPVSGGQMLTMWDWHKEIDIPFLRILKEMEQEGMPLDEEYMRQFNDPLEMASQQVLKRFQRETSDALVKAGGDAIDLNPGSYQQLSRFYFKSTDPAGKIIGLGFPVLARTDSGNASTGEKVMDELYVKHNAPGTSSLMEYRKLDKIRSTYVEGAVACIWDQTGKVHPSVKPWTATGRCVCQRPNMMNLPRDPLVFEVAATPRPAMDAASLSELWSISIEDADAELENISYLPTRYEVDIRRSVKAPDGYMLVGSDYANCEIVCTAKQSGDKALINILNEGKDMHSYTASIVFAPQVPGLKYDDIVEAKKWKDVSSKDDWASKAAMWRWATVCRALSGPSEAIDTILGPRLSHLSHDAQVGKLALFAKLLDELGDQLQGRKGVWSSKEALAVLEAAMSSDAEQEHVLRATSVMEKLAYQADGVDLDPLLDLLGSNDKALLDFRQAAKAAIFGIIYGISGVGLAVTITKATGQLCKPDDAQEIIDRIKNNAYPDIGKMVDRLHKTAMRYGYVRTLMGRYRHPAGLWSANRARISRSLRQAGNAPIQGLAANIIAVAMISLRFDERWNQMGAKMIMQVHDEILSIVPEEYAEEALELQNHHMENAYRLRLPVPLRATGGVAKVWCDIK